MTNKNIAEQIAFLRKCAKQYEHDGTSELSDQEYDKMYYELQKIDPDNPFFDEVGGELDEHIYGETIPHKIPMGSLSKSLCINDFENWLKNTFDRNDKIQFLLQHKVDGLSLSLLYKNKKLIQCLTRGDGEKGISVFNNVKYIDDIPKTIAYDGEVEIRGEIFKDKSDFQKNWKNLGYSNERSFAAGSLNQKDEKETGRRGLSFVAYEVVRKDDFHYQQEKIDFLEKNGFKTLKLPSRLTKEGDGFDEIAKTVEIYMNSIDRKSLPYLIDGVVAKFCDIKKGRDMGSTSNNRKPKSDRAIKYPPTIAETTLLNIEVETGRSGKLCPVGILREVEIDGSVISRVSLHNFGMITGKDALKIGAKVKIAKKGDIIPQVVEVVENEGTLFKIPDSCPSCNEKVQWSKSGVDLVCNNPECNGQLNNRIEFFLKTIGVDGIGPGIIKRLTANGNSYCIKSVSDIYNLGTFKDELAKEFGPTAAENILEAIGSISELELSKFVHAIGISKIGSMSKEIVRIADSVEKIDNLKPEDLLQIPGFAEIKANSFVDGWKKNRSEINKLLKYIKIKEVDMSKKSKSKLDGKSFLITGTLSKGRKEFQEIIENNGGINASGVSKNLDYLIVGEDAGSKEDKAKKLGIRIISEDEFNKML